jgi:hypothetical protein
VHSHTILLYLGDGTLGPCGVDLAEEEPRHLINVDPGRR